MPALRVLAEYFVAGIIFRNDGEAPFTKDVLIAYARHDPRLANHAVVFNAS